MVKTYKSAVERVHDDDLDDVVAVLTGPSPWQRFIDWSETKSRSPSDRFQVVDEKTFAVAAARAGEPGDLTNIPGITNKETGQVFLKEFFGINSRTTMLGFAVHELVHLCSHKPGRSDDSRHKHSTVWPILGAGLLEGLVEMITEDVFKAQNIELAPPAKRGHQKRVPVARELFKGLGTLPGRLLFEGEFGPFLLLMNEIYTPRGWIEIKSLTTDNHPDRAISRSRPIARRGMRRACGGSSWLGRHDMITTCNELVTAKFGGENALRLRAVPRAPSRSAYLPEADTSAIRR